MKFFLIQPEHQIEDFESFLQKGIGVPLNELQKFYDGFSISISEHYFNNFFNNYIKKEFDDKNDFINRLEHGDNDIIEWLFNNFSISIFIYNVMI
jgi:hypothetical protein